MIHSLVFETDLPFLERGHEPSPVGVETRLGGISLLRRAVLMARKAGADAVTVVARDAESAARLRDRGDLTAGAPVAAPEELALDGIDPADTVLLQTAAVLPGRGGLERVLRSFGGSTAVASTLGSEAAGPAATAGEALRSRAAAEGLVEGVRSLVRGPDAVRLPEEAAPCRRLVGPESLAEADRDLYRGLSSASDGYLDRTFHRRLSAWISRRIIDLPITPNGVTWVAFAVGLAAAALFWTGSYWPGVAACVLLQLSSVLDCVDGEVARIRYQFSAFGSWLDLITENLVTILVFAAAARAATSVFGMRTSLLLGGLAATGVVMCVIVITTLARLQERKRPGQASPLAATNRLSSHQGMIAPHSPGTVDALINQATSRDYTMVIVACALAGHLEWVVWLAGVGSHLFWILYAAIQVHRLRLSEAVGA